MVFQKLCRLVKADINLAYNLHVRNSELSPIKDLCYKQNATTIPGKVYDTTNEYSSPSSIVDAFATLSSGAFLPKFLGSDVPDINSNLPPLCLQSVLVDDIMQNKFTAGNDNE
ncbi:hypothetical protein Trydic_g7940 [Trypoxylus dichotomus]